MSDKNARLLEKAWFSVRYLYIHGLLSEAEHKRAYARLHKKARKLRYEAYAISPLEVGFRRVL